MSELAKIAAIVVTFNRKEWLVECIEALKKQTRPLDRIILVDNASTDGTSKLLEQHGILDDPIIDYMRLPNNTGGAGGFHEGLKRAFNSGYDWFWLMDDDVEPYPEGLERLLPFCSRSGCIHGRRVNPDGTPVLWGDYFDPRRIMTTTLADASFEESSDPKLLNVGCFEGMLVKREVVERIGLPAAEFFISWDDTVYGYQASLVTPVLYVNATTLRRKRAAEPLTIRPMGMRSKIKLSPMALYYFFRNRFLVAKSLQNYSPFFVWTSIELLFRSAFREAAIVNSWAGVKAVFLGTADGFRLWIDSSEGNEQRGHPERAGSR